MPNWCKHYRAMSEHDSCSAGVAYSSLFGLPFERRPCFKPQDDPTLCALAIYSTPAELAERERVIAARFEQTMVARAAIVQHAGAFKRGDGREGVIDCPVCNAKLSLRYRRAGCNGHVAARCDSAGCVAWME